jgi:8-oxo-dGTP diphosphatase
MVRPTVTEIIGRAVIRRDDRLLVAREVGSPWCFLPGGHVEAGEPVETALIREIAEELGSGAWIDGFAGVVEHGYVTQDGTAHHEINLLFHVGITDREPASRESHLEFGWLSLTLLTGTDLRPAPLKEALLSTAGGEIPFWRPWSG